MAKKAKKAKKAKTKKAKTPRSNTRFPGRPGYTGPREGYFGFVHHQKLYEWSHNIMERVRYIKKRKPPSEKPIRLHHLVYLGNENMPLITDRGVLRLIKKYIRNPKWRKGELWFQ